MTPQEIEQTALRVDVRSLPETVQGEVLALLRELALRLGELEKELGK